MPSVDARRRLLLPREACLRKDGVGGRVIQAEAFHPTIQPPATESERPHSRLLRLRLIVGAAALLTERQHAIARPLLVPSKLPGLHLLPQV